MLDYRFAATNDKRSSPTSRLHFWWSAAVFACDGRFQPYTGVPDGLQSLTWQRFRRRNKNHKNHNYDWSTCYPCNHSITITPLQSVKHVTCTSTATGLPAGKIRLHCAAGRANRKAKPAGVVKGSARALAPHLTSVFCKLPGREVIRTSWIT